MGKINDEPLSESDLKTAYYWAIRDINGAIGCFEWQENKTIDEYKKLLEEIKAFSDVEKINETAAQISKCDEFGVLKIVVRKDYESNTRND